MQHEPSPGCGSEFFNKVLCNSAATLTQQWISVRCASLPISERETSGVFCRALRHAPTVSANSRGTARPCQSSPKRCHQRLCAWGDSPVSAEPRHHRRPGIAALRAPAPSSPASLLWEPCGRSPRAQNVAPQQTGALLDVALRQFLFLAQGPQTVVDHPSLFPSTQCQSRPTFNHDALRKRRFSPPLPSLWHRSPLPLTDRTAPPHIFSFLPCCSSGTL